MWLSFQWQVLKGTSAWRIPVAALHQGAPGCRSNDLAGRSTVLAPPCLALHIALLQS